MQCKINTYPDNIYAYISVFLLLDPRPTASVHVASASLCTYCHRTRSQNTK